MRIIGNLFNYKNINTHIQFRVEVNEIACLNCNIEYVCETSNSVKKQIEDYMRDLKKGNINNGLVRHNLETNNNFNFKEFKMLVYLHN